MKARDDNNYTSKVITNVSTIFYVENCKENSRDFSEQLDILGKSAQIDTTLSSVHET